MMARSVTQVNASVSNILTPEISSSLLTTSVVHNKPLPMVTTSNITFTPSFVTTKLSANNLPAIFGESREPSTTTQRPRGNSLCTRPSKLVNDVSPSEPIPGEKPNDLLMRLYDIWPEQLAESYRPHVNVNPASSAENNLRFLKELYPPNKARGAGGLSKARTAGVVVETVCHLGKKMMYTHVARAGEVFASSVRG